MRATPLIERFWTYVASTEPGRCWIWTGATNNRGYGSISPGSHRQTIGAHRASWLIHFGEIPEDQRVLHRCDTPSCVNPAHLFLGTQKDNTRDMMVKGRARFGQNLKGESHGKAKLTDANVRTIREMSAEGVSRVAIAQQFSIGTSSIRRILLGIGWTHVK